MKKLIITFICILTSIIAYASPNAKKTETWVGQEEQSVISVLKSANKKINFDGGGIKGGTAQVVYNVANPKKPVPLYIWVSPVSNKVSKITGVMKVPSLRAGEIFGYDCDPAESSAVAVVKRNDAVAHLRATKAWNVDAASGKFNEIPAKGITCLNPAVNF